MRQMPQVAGRIGRRSFVQAGLAGGILAASPGAGAAAIAGNGGGKFHFALNTSTVRGQKLSVPEQFELAANAGYDGVEPWIGELRQYAESGGSVVDLQKRIADHGLRIPSAIGFAEWIVSDDARRAKGFEQAKRDMELVKAIGGTHIAAPPAGATKETNIPLSAIAERYGKLLELGDQMGVIPELEVWGPSATLSKLSEAAFVAAETHHPKACLLLDIYHLYKGGSGFDGLRLVAGKAMNCLHFNDYEAMPPRESIRDADRVYPGDGIAPLAEVIHTLDANGFQGFLSLELFNQTYWKEDPAVVARIGIVKMKEAVAKALGR